MRGTRHAAVNGETTQASDLRAGQGHEEHSGLTALVEEVPAPITVVRNGYGAFVIMRGDEYEAMQTELAWARLLSRVSKAEAEYAAEDYADGKGFTRRYVANTACEYAILKGAQDAFHAEVP